MTVAAAPQSLLKPQGRTSLGTFLGTSLGASFACLLRLPLAPGLLAFLVGGAPRLLGPGRPLLGLARLGAWRRGRRRYGGKRLASPGQPSSTAAPALPAARVAGRLWPAAPNRSFAVAAGRLSAVRPGAGWCPARWSRACPVRRRRRGGDALPGRLLPCGIGSIRGRRLRNGGCSRRGRGRGLRRFGGYDGRRLHRAQQDRGGEEQQEDRRRHQPDAARMGRPAVRRARSCWPVLPMRRERSSFSSCWRARA